MVSSEGDIRINIERNRTKNEGIEKQKSKQPVQGIRKSFWLEEA